MIDPNSPRGFLLRRAVFVVVILVVFITLGACSSNSASQLQDTTRKSEFRGFDFDHSDDYGDSLTLKFKDMTTDKTIEVDDGWASEYDTEDLLRMLNWLNKGDCYTNPLSETGHTEVPCG